MRWLRERWQGLKADPVRLEHAEDGLVMLLMFALTAGATALSIYWLLTHGTPLVGRGAAGLGS